MGDSEPARLLVKPRIGLALEQFDSILRDQGARRVGAITQIGVYIIELSPKADTQAVVLSLQANPGH